MFLEHRPQTGSPHAKHSYLARFLLSLLAPIAPPNPPIWKPAGDEHLSPDTLQAVAILFCLIQFLSFIYSGSKDIQDNATLTCRGSLLSELSLGCGILSKQGNGQAYQHIPKPHQWEDSFRTNRILLIRLLVLGNQGRQVGDAKRGKNYHWLLKNVHPVLHHGFHPIYDSHVCMNSKHFSLMVSPLLLLFHTLSTSFFSFQALVSGGVQKFIAPSL